MKLLRWSGKWFVVIPALVLAGLIMGGMTNRQEAVSAYGTTADEVGFSLGTAIFALPRLVSNAKEAKTYHEADQSGQSTVPKTKAKT